mgnify:CR=1 FL=1
MNTTYVWWAVAIYIILSLIVAFLSRTGKEDNMVGYFLGGRLLGGVVSALSYSATTYSAFMLVGLAGLTYRGGVGALGFELIYLMGVSLIAFFGPRFWVVGKKYGYVTPSEMLGDRYQDKRIAVLVALTSCLFLIPYSAVQLSGVGYLLSGLTDNEISFSTGVLIATIMAVLFAYIAGIRSVAWTDSLQAIFMIISATLVILVLIHGLGGFNGFFQELETTHPESLTVPGNGFFDFLTFAGMTIPWMFFSLSNPQVSQRLFMPASMKNLKIMILGFMIFGLIYTLVATLWGFSATIMFPDLENVDLATPMILSSELVPPILGVIVMVGIMAAAISTIDSILLTLASVFAKDVYGNVRKKSTDRMQLQIGKIVIPVIAILAYSFAELELNIIVLLSVASSAGLVIVVPAIFGTFFWKRGTAAGVLASIGITGFIVILLEAFQWKPLGIASGIWGLALSTTIFIIVSLCTEPPKEKAEEFFHTIKTALKAETVKKG